MGLMSNHGRIYFPGLAEGSAHALLAGQWDSYRQFEKQLVMPAGATAANAVTASPTGYNHPRCYHPPIRDGEASWRPAGRGDLHATGYAAQLAEIDLTGSGDLDATAGLIISAILAMAGSGDIALSAQGRLNAALALTGSGDLDALASGLAEALLEMTGAGDLDALAMGYANASLDIVVTGTGLSTANVGGAVWNALAAAFNATGTMGQKLNAAGSGGVDLGALADAILARSLAGGADGGRTVRDALRASRNRVVISGNTLTVYAEDDTTPAWTATITTAQRDALQGVDPA